MKLPNLEKAWVPEEKITDYLLSEENPKGKAGFFKSFGFYQGAVGELEEALLEHGRSHEVTATKRTIFGTQYILEGPLYCPDGRAPSVKTVWQIDEAREAPRFITSYPLE